MVRSSIQKFDNDYDIIFMFNIIEHTFSWNKCEKSKNLIEHSHFEDNDVTAIRLKQRIDQSIVGISS